MQNFKNMNKPEAEISKRMIILSDENYSFSRGKNTQQNEETCIGYCQMVSANDSSINGSWNTYL